MSAEWAAAAAATDAAKDDIRSAERKVIDLNNAIRLTDSVIHCLRQEDSAPAAQAVAVGLLAVLRDDVARMEVVRQAAADRAREAWLVEQPLIPQ